MELTPCGVSYSDFVWNITHGCYRRSPGCNDCWAEAQESHYHPDVNFGETWLRYDKLHQPLGVTDEVSCFIDDTSDLFYEGEADPNKRGVPDSFIDKALDVVELTPTISYLTLTKRVERAKNYFMNHHIPSNLFVGYSICTKAEVKNIDILRQISTENKWISFEPLLDDVASVDGFSLEGIKVAIVGGEQVHGKTARKMEKQWVLNIKKACERDGCLFYFKQWGDWSENGEHKNTKANGHLIDGVAYRQLPWPNEVQQSY